MILKDCIEDTFGIDCTARVSGLRKSHHVRIISNAISKNQSLTENTEPSQTEGGEYFVDRITRHVIQDGVVKYVVRLYGYLLEEDATNLHHHLPNQFAFRYWHHSKSRRR